MKICQFTSNPDGTLLTATADASCNRLRQRVLSILLTGAILAATGCASTGSGESSLRADQDPLYDGVASITFDSLLTSDRNADFEQLGDLALRQGEQDKAIYAYLRAIQKGGDKAALFSKIGAVHQIRRNHELALLAFSRALAAEPAFVPALQGAGLVTLSLRQHSEARGYLRLAVAKDQQRLGGVFSDNGDLATGPIPPQPPLTTRPAEETEGDTPHAGTRESTPLLHDDHSPHQVYNGLGMLADLAGEHQQALRYYQVAIAIRPNSAIIHNNLGYSHYLSGDLATGEHHFLRAINLDPNFKRGWRNLALVYARQGRQQDALMALSRVMSSAEAYNTLGYLSMLEGNHVEANRLLQQAIALSPSYYELAQQNLVQNRSRDARNAAN